MPPSSRKRIAEPGGAVVPCRCIAMTIALELVAEHRRQRAQADLEEEEELAKCRARTTGNRSHKGNR
jgi:hypothetical protein